MTVGIAAICNGKDGESPAAILAADRLVTTGRTTRIEYEGTESKIEEVLDSSSLRSVAVAAGSLALADDLFFKMGEAIVNEPPHSIRDIVHHGIDSFHKLEHETFNNQVLGPLDLQLEDLKKGDLALAKEYQKGLLQDVLEKQQEIERNLRVLFADVDDNGAHIYSLEEADMARHDGTGYATVGSGSQSAQLTFTRNRYDKECSLADGLMTVIEAKARAEEAQGVGTKMDIVIVREDSIERIAGDDVDPYRELQTEIELKESEARENTIESSELEYLTE